MKRPLPYSYHFNFGRSRTQEHIKPRLITSYMEEQHNIPPNKRTCSRKEINALQADEDTIPYSAQTIIIRPYHTGGNNTFQYGQVETRPLPYGQPTSRKGYYLPYIAL